MKAYNYKPSYFSFRPLASGLLGMALLMPASFFMLTLLARAGFGSKSLYYSIAPSFLQSPFDLFALHKAQCIVGGVVMAIAVSGLAVVKLSLEQGTRGWDVRISFRRDWLNTAIALQGLLLLAALVTYTVVQHIRY
jgi:hypothetical protein